MSFSIGIVGLPNVGKSTLFNALTNLGVEAANYPFATIEPNVGVVAVPDPRLEKLARLEKSEKIIPATVEFKDIAGLVAGAHQGAGLGNQFLAHIREVDAIAEVVRFFADENVIHVDGRVDPKRDLETVETELALADLQLVEKKLEGLKRTAKNGKTEDVLRAQVAQKYFDTLGRGDVASAVRLTDEEKKYIHEFPLLTNKPFLYIANVQSGQPPPSIGGKAFLSLDLKLEAELAELEEAERTEYLQGLGLPMTGLQKLIQASYQSLELITFFTAGPKETRAWTCKRGTKAPQAAGIIHTDFERGFIKAEVINWQTLLDAGGDVQAREKGLLRQEGKEYQIQDGDVVHFRFNV